MQKITEDLFNELKNVQDIKKFLDTHETSFISETPVSVLNYLLKSKNMTVSQVARLSGTGEYVYKVFNAERKPSRNVIISIALGMGLSIEEIQLLLRVSKFATLDSRDKRDSIIIYGFMNNLSAFEVDDLLEENGFLTIN